MKITVRPTRKSDAKAFLSLVDALADYEKLPRPTPAARKRLIRDGFGARKRFESLFVEAGGVSVGYAFFFETYSSFLALPTLYLEDLFILPDYRGKGLGKKLFAAVLAEAKRRKCGRMEWVVLDWNTPAIGFYDRLGAEQLKDWLIYRIAL
jgi:GNAT superfamily N-acetyltransferase